MHRADLLEGMRKRVVPDVVEQRGGADKRAFVATDGGEFLLFLEEIQRAPGEVERSERVLESRMGGAGIDEKSEPELANVSEPLKRRRVDQLEAQRIESDVVPEGVPDDFHRHGPYDSLTARQKPPLACFVGTLCLRNPPKRLRALAARPFRAPAQRRRWSCSTNNSPISRRS